MDSASDDVRKKRDSAEVVEDGRRVAEEKTKKLKAQEPPNQSDSPVFSDAPSPINSKRDDKSSSPTAPMSPIPTASSGDCLKGLEAEATGLTSTPKPEPESHPDAEASESKGMAGAPVWDLESALHHVANMGDAKEYITEDKYISFRVGHAGDASAVESLYRRGRKVAEGKVCVSVSSKKSPTDDSSLDVWLADGFGGEDTPPSVFGLFVDTYGSEKACVLGAAALLTIAREDDSKVLRVEWLYVDRVAEFAEIVERRLWLRLCTLSLLTSSDALVIRESSPKPEGDKVAAS